MRSRIAVVFLLAGVLQAQDVDTIVLKNDDQKFTILSQIEDPKESAAFLSIVDAKDANERYANARSFLVSYPKSWLLAEANDALARSAIDLERYDEALSAARFSLRLVPENPSLLILVANLEAQRGQYTSGSRDANAALLYLDEIERPANLSQKDWTALKPQLKASAYFAKARAEVHSDNQAALHDLNEAVSWNRSDAEVAYLRAIVELRLKKNPEAIADLAFVAQNSTEWEAKADRVLRALAQQ